MIDDDRLERALTFLRIPGRTIAEACERYGVTKSRLARARRSPDARRSLDEEELVLAALSPGRPLDRAAIIEYADWVNHARWNEAELDAILSRLEARALVRRAGEEGWELIGEWP